MNFPILFYGVNLARIPEERRNFPKEVTSGEGAMRTLNLEALEELVEKHGLETFFSDDCDYIEYEVAHVGVQIKNNYVEGEVVESEQRVFFEECVRFDRKQIIDLYKNPSELLKRMKKIGLDVKPEELALYGYVGID